MEKLVQGTLADLLAVPPDKIHMKASIFDLGVSSFNLIMLKSMLDTAVQNVDRKEEAGDVPLSTLLNDPSVGAIARGIDEQLAKSRVYNPVVPLQTHGHKMPIWFIHPGSGDILVFISLHRTFPHVLSMPFAQGDTMPARNSSHPSVSRHRRMQTAS
jgi:hypothetical protein